MADPLCFVAEITLHDGSSAATYYYANRAFVTAPTDTPANIAIEGRLTQPVTAARNIFRTGGATIGRAETTEGRLILANDDGALDSLFKGAGISGRSLIVYQGVPGAAYPSGFTRVFRGTMTGLPELTPTTVEINVRGREEELDIPIQATLYAGTNTGGAGLEGTEELTGKSKPVCYGVVRNISPVCVNPTKQIYQVADKAMASIDAVYDGALNLEFGFPVTAVSGLSGSVGRVLMTDGTTYVASQGAGLYTTTDFVTFTLRQTMGVSAFDGEWCASISLFVVVGVGELWTSPTGVTWTKQAAATFAGKNLRRVIDGATSVVVSGSSTTELWSSTNGTAWTARTTALTAGSESGDYGDGRFIISGNISSEVAESTDDGVTWTLITVPTNSTNFTTGVINPDVAYLGTKWLIERANGEVAVSTNARDWSLFHSGFGPAADAVQIGEFHYHNSVYYAFSHRRTGSGTVPSAYTWSYDATTWFPLEPLGYPQDGETVGVHSVSRVLSYRGLMVLAGDSGLYVTESPAGTYASAADLEDDSLAPAAGTYKVFLNAAGSYFRLESPPIYQITADVTEGATAADRTVAQVWKRLLQDRGSLASGTDFSATDISTLDAALTGEVGVWIGPEPRSLSDVLDYITTPECWWAPDRTGIYRLKQLVAPSASLSVASFTASSIKGRLTRRPNTDVGFGLPCWKVVVYYNRNYTVQTSGLAGGIDDVTRVDLAHDWRAVTAEDATVKTKHLLAPTLFVYAPNASESDAQSIANRLLALRKVQMDRYPIPVEADSTNNTIDLGDVVTLSHSRFGLSSGVAAVVVGVAPNAADRAIGLELWANAA